jgi:hypothetical protein
MQGDLVVHLLAQSELHGPPSNLPPHRLQGILEAALRASSVAASPHAEVLLGEGVLSAAVDSRSLLQLVTAATCGSVDGGQQVCAQRLRMCFFSGALTSLSLFLHTHTLSHTFTHTHTHSTQMHHRPRWRVVVVCLCSAAPRARTSAAWRCC